MQVFKSEYFILGGDPPNYIGWWTHPSSLSDNISPDGQDAWQQQVAMDYYGNAIIVWMQSDGSNHQIFKSQNW
jgi:hypothetical protein